MFNKILYLINNLKNKLFPFYKNRKIKYIFKKLQDGLPREKIAARFVGGCVRKHILGENIDDIDIATILNSEEIKERFKNTHLKIINTGIKHGTITLIYDNFKFELTTLRKDIRTDGRHAEVEFTEDWIKDSERRDFTINSIYLDINGNIFDPQMGMTDLKNRNVKFIGDPQKRIEEDYLRIIRFIRFALQYDSQTDEKTIEALKLNLNGIKKVSNERILDELLKILSLKNFDNILKHHNKKLIFSLIFPELKFIDRIEKLKEVKKIISIDKNILLAILLLDEKENHEYFCFKYKVSNELKENLTDLNKNYLLMKNNRNFLEKDLEKNIYYSGKNNLIILHLLDFVCNPKYKINKFINILNKIKSSKIYKLPFDGKFLVQKGMKEGLMLGKTLKSIESEWLKNNFQISEQRVSEIIKQHSN